MSYYDLPEKEAIKELKSDIKELVVKVDEIDKKLAIYNVQFESHTIAEEKFYEEIKNISQTLVKNTQSLDEHIRRTDLLEKSLTEQNTRLTPVELDYLVRQENRKSLIFYAKVLGGIVALGSIFTGAAFLFKVLG